MTLQEILKASLISDGTDKSILPRYMRKMLGSKVGVAEANDLANMLMAYRDYTDSPRTYKGDFQELFGSLGPEFTSGVIQYAEMADLADGADTQVFLTGLSALELHLDDNTPLDDALAQYGHAEEPIAASHDRDDIITDEPALPDRVLEPEDAYSAAEIAALEKFSEDRA